MQGFVAAGSMRQPLKEQLELMQRADTLGMNSYTYGQPPVTIAQPWAVSLSPATTAYAHGTSDQQAGTMTRPGIPQPAFQNATDSSLFPGASRPFHQPDQSSAMPGYVTEADSVGTQTAGHVRSQQSFEDQATQPFFERGNESGVQHEAVSQLLDHDAEAAPNPSQPWILTPCFAEQPPGRLTCTQEASLTAADASQNDHQHRDHLQQHSEEAQAMCQMSGTPRHGASSASTIGRPEAHRTPSKLAASTGTDRGDSGRKRSRDSLLASDLRQFCLGMPSCPMNPDFSSAVDEHHMSLASVADNTTYIHASSETCAQVGSSNEPAGMAADPQQAFSAADMQSFVPVHTHSSNRAAVEVPNAEGNPAVVIEGPHVAHAAADPPDAQAIRSWHTSNALLGRNAADASRPVDMGQPGQSSSQMEPQQHQPGPCSPADGATATYPHHNGQPATIQIGSLEHWAALGWTRCADLRKDPVGNTAKPSLPAPACSPARHMQIPGQLNPHLHDAHAEQLHASFPRTAAEQALQSPETAQAGWTRLGGQQHQEAAGRSLQVQSAEDVFTSDSPSWHQQPTLASAPLHTNCDASARQSNASQDACHPHRNHGTSVDCCRAEGSPHQLADCDAPPAETHRADEGCCLNTAIQSDIAMAHMDAIPRADSAADSLPSTQPAEELLKDPAHPSMSGLPPTQETIPIAQSCTGPALRADADGWPVPGMLEGQNCPAGSCPRASMDIARAHQQTDQAGGHRLKSDMQGLSQASQAALADQVSAFMPSQTAGPGSQSLTRAAGTTAQAPQASWPERQSQQFMSQVGRVPLVDASQASQMESRSQQVDPATLGHCEPDIADHLTSLCSRHGPLAISWHSKEDLQLKIIRLQKQLSALELFCQEDCAARLPKVKFKSCGR